MSVVDTWTVQIILDDNPPANGWLIGDLPISRWMAETEENLADLFPPGYAVRILKWNDPDEGEPSE